jgi:anion-transporting  ArsA/GET3 family ATPase
MTTPQIFLICGSGGVGKTTVAASLGLRLATRGKKVIVLTVDPAKRLATSLGLENLGDEPKKIVNPVLSKVSGEMWAMMLDTKRTFDRLVERHAPSEAARDKIFNNKIYQHLSGMLAGTQEYMAMERLYEVVQQNRYDTVVVDTPPMQNAKDFLSAPQRMMDMVNNSMLHLLIKPAMAVGKTGFRFFEKGSQQILKVFDRITGFAFLQDISEMLIAFQALLGGFEKRASDVRGLLSKNQCRFIVVCTTQDHSVREVQDFISKAAQLDNEVWGIVANRVYAGPVPTADKLKEHRGSLKKVFSPAECDILIENYQRFSPLIKRDQKILDQIKSWVAPGQMASIPLFFSDVHDAKGLLRVGDHLSFV